MASLPGGQRNIMAGIHSTLAMLNSRSNEDLNQPQTLTTTISHNPPEEVAKKLQLFFYNNNNL